MKDMPMMESRRRRGIPKPKEKMSDMHAIMSAGMDRGMEVESASMNQYGPDATPSISVTFRKKGRKRGA